MFFTTIPADSLDRTLFVRSVKRMRRVCVVVLAGILSACAGGGGGKDRREGATLQVARAALRGGAPQIALRAATARLADDPADAAAYLVQGDALTALGRLEQAEWSYRAALHRRQDMAAAHLGVGRCLLATRPAEAERQFQFAIDREPGNAAAWNDIGVARDLLRRHDDAQVAYRRALVLNPQMIGAQVNLALSLAMSGDAGAAERLVRPLAEDAGATAKLRHDLAAVLAMGGDREEAARILSSDLSPQQIAQALSAYRAARGGDASSRLAAPPVAE